MRLVKHWRQLHSEVLVPILCDIKTSARASPGEPALAESLCHEQDGRTRWFRVSCWTHPFFISVILLPNKTKWQFKTQNSTEKALLTSLKWKVSGFYKSLISFKYSLWKKKTHWLDPKYYRGEPYKNVMNFSCCQLTLSSINCRVHSPQLRQYSPALQETWVRVLSEKLF